MPDSSFYVIVNVLLFVYACYSWYWQAKLDLRGKYRYSVIFWTIIIIWLGFAWNYIDKSYPGINVFLALLLITSIVDGYTGFAPKRAVISGFFKRTIPYSDIEDVLLIKVPNFEKPSVICIMRTNKGRQYYLRFSGEVNKIVAALKKHVDHTIRVEIQDKL